MSCGEGVGYGDYLVVGARAGDVWDMGLCNVVVGE